MATRARMRIPFRTVLRSSGEKDGMEFSRASSTSCLIRLLRPLFLFASLISCSRSGGSWAAGLSLRVMEWPPAGADGTWRAPSESIPAPPCRRRAMRPAGPSV